MALFYALTSKHLLPEKRGGEGEGKKERCSTINSPRATRCSLLVDHVIEESKTAAAREAHLIGAQISWQDSFDDSAPLSCPQTHT